MKRLLIGICFVLAIVTSASLIPARARDAVGPVPQAAENGAPANPPRFRFHWYPVGQGPLGMAFDGANIWTANYGEGSVTKLRASDGKKLGTFELGGVPTGVTFDGANIWESDSGGDTVTELRASDGKKLRTFNLGPAPAFMAFDGANIWVTTTPTTGRYRTQNPSQRRQELGELSCRRGCDSGRL